MGIRVKIATTSEDLDNLFLARHAVFSEEESYFKKTKNRRVFDQIDAFPSTVNLMAMVDKQVVGGLRLTEHCGEGALPNDLFDFSPYLPKSRVKNAMASMFCMKREFRKIPRLTFMLLCMGVFWAISRKVRYIVAGINPQIEHLTRGIGFKPVDSVFRHNKHRVDVLPVVLDLKRIEPDLLEMTKFHGFFGTLRTFDREFYRAGEFIIRSGSKGDAAYVVVDGKVTISRAGRRRDDPPRNIISELSSGEIFGELALLTNKIRTADVIAATDVDLMVIEREVFREQLLGNAELQKRLLELLGRRLISVSQVVV